jgi:predicted nucleic acid-binding protein
VIKIDACSLIYLSKIDFWEIIFKLYGELVITPAVLLEVVTKGKEKGKPDAFIIERKINENFLKIHTRKGSLPDFNLGIGETETIKETLEEQVMALIDDKKARLIGTKLGLQIKNISLALIEALLNDHIDETQFDKYLVKWAMVSSPKQEEILFLNQLKELIKERKKK